MAILGQRGSGKSTLAREVVAERARVVVLDSQGEYGAAEKCRELWGFEAGLAALERAEREREFRLSLRVVRAEDTLDLVRVCYELRDYLLVVEEASLYCRPWELPDEFANLIRYGRHRGIDLLFVARRPSEVHRDVTAQADLVISFVQKEPRDLAYFAALAGRDARELRTLPRGRFLVFGSNLEAAPRAVLERMRAQEKGP